MNRLSAQQIAEVALRATGHRSVSPEMMRWITQLVELVRRLDQGEPQ